MENGNMDKKLDKGQFQIKSKIIIILFFVIFIFFGTIVIIKIISINNTKVFVKVFLNYKNDKFNITNDIDVLKPEKQYIKDAAIIIRYYKKFDHNVLIKLNKKILNKYVNEKFINSLQFKFKVFEQPFVDKNLDINFYFNKKDSNNFLLKIERSNYKNNHLKSNYDRFDYFEININDQYEIFELR